MQGKLSSDELKSVILSNIEIKNDDVLVKANLGEDCAVIDSGEESIILTMDPITATSEHLGKLLVRINANDILASGAKPKFMMITLLMPTTCDVEDLKIIMQDVKAEIDALGIDLIGGHTEFTDAVNSPTAIAVMIAKKSKDKLLSITNIEVGDTIVMTGTSGIEGTGIIACEKADELSKEFGKDFVERAKTFVDKTLVLDSAIKANEIGVKAMHDVTEGGVFGAVWEMITGAKLGCQIEMSKIKVADVTEKITNFYNINPNRLIGSGSLIIVVSSEKADKLVNELNQMGENASKIGIVTKSKVMLYEDDKLVEIDEPSSDELYKVL